MAGILRDPIEEIHILPGDNIHENPHTFLEDAHRNNTVHDPFTRNISVPFFRKPIYKCEKCDITVTSRNVLNRHLMGRKHIQRVEREGKTFECDLCGIVANGQTQLDSHLQSSRHKTRLFKKEHGHEIISKGAMVILLSICFIFFVFLTASKVFL